MTIDGYMCSKILCFLTKGILLMYNVTSAVTKPHSLNWKQLTITKQHINPAHNHIKNIMVKLSKIVFYTASIQKTVLLRYYDFSYGNQNNIKM